MMPVLIVAELKESPGWIGSKRRLNWALQVFVRHGPDRFLCSLMAIGSVGLECFHRGQRFDFLSDRLAFRIRSVGSLRCKPALPESFVEGLLLSVDVKHQLLGRPYSWLWSEVQLFVTQSSNGAERDRMGHVKVLK